MYSAKPEENENAPSVPKSEKKRSKSLIATPKKEKKLTVAFEVYDTAATIQSCSSPTEAQGSSNTSTEVLPTFEKNEIDAPELIKKRGKSLTATVNMTPTKHKTAEKRSHSLEIALSRSTLRKSCASVNGMLLLTIFTLDLCSKCD